MPGLDRTRFLMPGKRRSELEAVPGVPRGRIVTVREVQHIMAAGFDQAQARAVLEAKEIFDAVVEGSGPPSVACPPTRDGKAI